MSIAETLVRKSISGYYSTKQRFAAFRTRHTSHVLMLTRSLDQQAKFPKNQFTKQGYEVIEGFLDAETCDRLRGAFETYLYESLPPEESNAYVVERKRQPLDSYDRQVYQLMNAQNLDDLRDICESIRQRLEPMFRERIEVPFYINSFSLQRDFPDDESKRPFHNDSFGLQLKAFIYLTDVPERKNGPYTVVPGSHRHLFKKLRSLRANLRTGNKRLDDLFHSYDDRDAVSFCGPKGTLILSNQLLVHKGWQEHTEGVRDVMVVYVNLEPIPEWTLGKNLALTEPLSVSTA